MHRDPPAFTDPRHQLGWDGELRAMRWFADAGFRIEHHRWKLGRHDIDLVVRQGPLVAFVEVKARSGPWCGAGEEAVTAEKRAILTRVAWSWILAHGRPGDQYRFDVLALMETEVRHIPDAWRPGWR